MADTTKKGGSDKGQNSRGKLLSFGNLLKLPATLGTVRSFIDAVNWNAAEDDIQSELKRKIVITGLANSGKSTLFNKIQGRYRSTVSSTEGTTVAPVRGAFGPFVLVDTPGHLPDVQEESARNAAVILMLIDATKGLRKEDRDLFARLKSTNRPIIIAMNKIDAIKGDPEYLSGTIAATLGIEDVIPISGMVGTNVAEDLMPALIEASPEAALAIGRQLPMFRRQAAERLVRNAALISLAAGMEPLPLIDIPIILGNQIRMVLRIAAIYGEPLTAKYTRELITAIASSLTMRYVAELAAKAVPFGGDLVSGAIAAASTWSIGWVAIEYFESDKKLSPNQIRSLFGQFYQRFRSTKDPKDAVKLIPPDATQQGTVSGS